MLHPKWQLARIMITYNPKYNDQVYSMILSSFYTGPNRNGVIYVTFIKN